MESHGRGRADDPSAATSYGKRQGVQYLEALDGLIAAANEHGVVVTEPFSGTTCFGAANDPGPQPAVLRILAGQLLPCKRGCGYYRCPAACYQLRQ